MNTPAGTRFQPVDCNPTPSRLFGLGVVSAWLLECLAAKAPDFLAVEPSDV